MYVPARDTNGNAISPASSPFTSKKLPDGKSLFQRVHGVAIPLDGTGNTASVTFTVPYPACKITGVNIIGGVLGDSADFQILDTPVGTISGTPDAPINQFGFGVYVAPGFFKHESSYDADLFTGLQIKVTITPGDTTARSVYANLVLHEVK